MARLKKINIYTKPLTTYVTEAKKLELQKVSKFTRTSMSELLRQAVDVVIERNKF